MTDPPRVAHRRKRSYLRLPSQVMAVLLAATGGWLAWIAYTAKVQHDAVVAIEKAGGSVVYDWELRDSHLPWWLKWAVDHLGVDALSFVVIVRLQGKATGPELA